MVETERPEEARKLFDRFIAMRSRNRLTIYAFSKVNRRDFAPHDCGDVYLDGIIQLGDGASISQPSLVAEMIDWLALTGTERVLEIGTGSGCNAALLSCCAEKVYTVEYNHSLASSAREKLKEKGFENVDVVEGDGILGLPDEKPFDAIIVTAGLREIPKNLADQLNPHFGRMIAPVGEDPSHQNLVIITRIEGEFYVFKDKPVSFHPLMSEHRGGWTRESIDELKRNKTDFVIKMVEDCGRSEEELQEKITNICGKPPFSGSAC